MLVIGLSLVTGLEIEINCIRSLSTVDIGHWPLSNDYGRP